jgi:1-phosphatidylinositol-3-phosphate 5-kinase
VTLLGKIVGVYKIGFKNGTTGAGLKMDVLIIENLFYEKKIDRSYDLKVSPSSCRSWCVRDRRCGKL